MSLEFSIDLRKLSVYEICRIDRWAGTEKAGMWQPERLQSNAAIHIRAGGTAMGTQNAGPGM